MSTLVWTIQGDSLLGWRELGDRAPGYEVDPGNQAWKNLPEPRLLGEFPGPREAMAACEEDAR